MAVANDLQTDATIAAAAGITDRQLRTWKVHPDFAARVEEHRAMLRQAAVARGIAERQNRVDALNDRWRKMHQVIEERAADETFGAYDTQPAPEGSDEPPVRSLAPGWKTGLLVRTEKQIGAGEKSVRVVEFAVDTGLLKELRAHEEQAAKELGQWVEKQDNSGVQRVQIEYVNDWRDDPR